MSWSTPRTWAPGELVTSTMLNQHLRDNLVAILPVASLIYRVAPATAVETVLENRFLECNGVAVSRTTYAALFSYLNGLSTPLPFGIGDGSTTFNLPDFRGRLPVSAAGVGGKAIIDSVGDSDGLAQTARNISHIHRFNGNNGVSGPAGGLGGDGSNTATTGDNANVNAPAYLVAGVWFIKYTS